jgi:hypothetical protein
MQFPTWKAQGQGLGSSGRVLQALGPEFNPHNAKKKKEEEEE